MRSSAIAIVLLASCTDDTPDEPVVWGDVDPAFTEALAQYEGWGKSCEPGNPAREAGIKAGVLLFKVDALTCQYQRLIATNSEEQDLESVVEIAGRLYAMTGNNDLRNVGQCGLSHETRIDMRFNTLDLSDLPAHQPTTDSISLPDDLPDHLAEFYRCANDYVIHPVE
ncbi:MAG: hypothetical protein AAFY34_03850 [Pseudomonadota bacterium]